MSTEHLFNVLTLLSRAFAREQRKSQQLFSLHCNWRWDLLRLRQWTGSQDLGETRQINNNSILSNKTSWKDHFLGQIWHFADRISVRWNDDQWSAIMHQSSSDFAVLFWWNVMVMPPFTSIILFRLLLEWLTSLNWTMPAYSADIAPTDCYSWVKLFVIRIWMLMIRPRTVPDQFRSLELCLQFFEKNWTVWTVLW